MTPQPTRRDGSLRGSPERGAQTGQGEGSHRSQNRWLLLAAVVLIVALCIVIAMLLRDRTTLPAYQPNGPGPQPLLVILGPGEGELPKFVRPLGVAWAPGGRIYVSDTGNGRICVFDADGSFEREFGRLKSSKSASVRPLQQPAGIAVGAQGEVYVADVRGGAVVVFDRHGTVLKRIRPRTPAGAKQRRWAPTDVAVTGGRIYVTDAAGVAVFSADGSPESRIDSNGDGLRFGYPNGVAVTQGEALVVSDTNNRRVVSVDQSGTLLWTSRSADGGQGVVGLPRGLAVASDGSVLVADAFRFGIVHLSRDGVAIESYGQRGSEPGSFEFPNDVAVNSDLVVVADKENNRVQVIRWPGLLGVDRK